jgi:hypothetical protein
MKPVYARFKMPVWLWILAGFFSFGLLACLAPVSVYDTLVLRHQRAYQRWLQRQPAHYRYQIRLDSPYLYIHYRVVVRAGKPVQVTNMLSGNAVNMTPNTANTYLPGYQTLVGHMLIDDLFGHIRYGTALPRSARGLIGRGYPTFYAGLVGAGWLPDGWQGCSPAFPKARYNRVYGYPEELTLFGQPCAGSSELRAAIKIQIHSFQVLP